MTRLAVTKVEYEKKDKCKYCSSRENLTIDHKLPISLGGKDEKKNLQTLCYGCNQLKSSIPHQHFVKIMKHGVYCTIKRYEAKKISKVKGD